MKLNNEKINKVLELLRAVQQEVNDTIKQEQEACQHSNIAECPYQESTYYSNGQPPIRVCLDCGLAEGGWSFKVLFEKSVPLSPRGISRELLFKLKQGDMV